MRISTFVMGSLLVSAGLQAAPVASAGFEAVLVYLCEDSARSGTDYADEYEDLLSKHPSGTVKGCYIGDYRVPNNAAPGTRITFLFWMNPDRNMQSQPWGGGPGCTGYYNVGGEVDYAHPSFWIGADTSGLVYYFCRSVLVVGQDDNVDPGNAISMLLKIGSTWDWECAEGDLSLGLAASCRETWGLETVDGSGDTAEAVIPIVYTLAPVPL